MSGATGTDPVAGATVPAGFMGPTSAIKPGSSPEVPEVWRTAALVNSWTGTLKYKLLAANVVQVYALLNVPAGVANPSVIFTMPAGYVPLTTSQPIGAIDNAGSPFAGLARVCEVLTGSGDLHIYDAVAGDTVRIFGSYPIDL
jgi:hypothetical protein